MFEALFEAATEDGDVNAARLLIDRAIPSRRGAPVSFSLRPLRSPPDCGDALDDLLVAVSEGKLTRDEAFSYCRQARRAVPSVELAAEIDALKAQLAAFVGRPPPPTPIRRPFAIT